MFILLAGATNASAVVCFVDIITTAKYLKVRTLVVFKISTLWHC